VIFQVSGGVYRYSDFKQTTIKSFQIFSVHHSWVFLISRCRSYKFINYWRS